MDIQPLEILKWTGIVLAAGFIGYFGRYLAMMILRETRKKENATGVTVKGESTGSSDESRIKIEKKKAKRDVKLAKKAEKK
jgi:hypothetical protein